MSIRIVFFVCILATLAALHMLFLQFRIYESIAWLDIPVHLFAGAVVGLGLVAMTDFKLRWVNGVQSLRLATILLLAIVLAWEVFGYLFLGSSLRPDYLSDTMIDIVAGFGGGSIGLYIGHRLAVIR